MSNGFKILILVFALLAIAFYFSRDYLFSIHEGKIEHEKILQYNEQQQNQKQLITNDASKSCEKDLICPSGFYCYNSQYSAPSPEGYGKMIKGSQEGDLLCHKLCSSDVDCSIGECSEKRVYMGDAVVIKKFCF